MKRLLSILFALSLVVGLATGAGAALTFDVDFWAAGNLVNNYDKGGPGDLGGTFDLFVGESINVDIYFSTDQKIVAGSWDLQFSPAALASVEGKTAAGSPWGFAKFDETLGSVKYEDALATLGSEIEGNNIFFGSVLFQCQGVGDVGLKLAVDPAIGGFLTKTEVIPFDDVNLGTLNQQVVPIPGAVWLLGTGLIGLVGIRRKRQN